MAVVAFTVAVCTPLALLWWFEPAGHQVTGSRANMARWRRIRSRQRSIRQRYAVCWLSPYADDQSGPQDPPQDQ